MSVAARLLASRLLASRLLASRLLALATLAALASCRAPEGGADASTVRAAELPIRAKALRFGVSSYSGTAVESAAAPLVRYLESALGIPVTLVVDEPYEALPAALLAGEVDLAQLPPFAYVRVKAEEPAVSALATPVIGGSPAYVGHLYVREESPFDDLADLAGRRVGYVSPDSTSGYLFPRALLAARGLDPDRFFGLTRFYRSHAAVIAAVLRGEVDVGASFDLTSDWANLADARERPPGLRVVAKTARVPNDCVVARAELDPGTRAAVSRALLDLRPGHPQADRVLAGLRVNGWVRADERRYDGVREVLAREALQASGFIAVGTGP